LSTSCSRRSSRRSSSCGHAFLSVTNARHRATMRRAKATSAGGVAARARAAAAAASASSASSRLPSWSTVVRSDAPSRSAGFSAASLHQPKVGVGSSPLHDWTRTCARRRSPRGAGWELRFGVETRRLTGRGRWIANAILLTRGTPTNCQYPTFPAQRAFSLTPPLRSARRRAHTHTPSARRHGSIP